MTPATVMGFLLTSEAGRKADGAISGLDLDEERAEHIDAPMCPRGAVLLPL